MVGKKSKWAAHLKAAESSGLSLAAYATKHKFDVRRLSVGTLLLTSTSLKANQMFMRLASLCLRFPENPQPVAVRKLSLPNARV